MNGNHKLFSVFALIILVLGNSQYCSCQQENVSFDQLFPESPYKQALLVCMNIWSGLRSIQKMHLSAEDQYVMQNFMIGCLNSMKHYIKTLNQPHADCRSMCAQKYSYMCAVLLHICNEHRDLIDQTIQEQ